MAKKASMPWGKGIAAPKSIGYISAIPEEIV